MTSDLGKTSDLLQSDQRFAAFLAPSFDSSRFASDALSNKKTSPQEEIDQLQIAIKSLDEQIRGLVLENRDQLLHESRKLESSNNSFQKLFVSVRSLQSVAARVRSEVSEPYGNIGLKTQQLRNLYQTINLLRQSIHQIKIVQRLKSEIQSERHDLLDLSKIARLLSEAKTLGKEVDLSGIKICDENEVFVQSCAENIREKIMGLLKSGMDVQSQAEIGGALQALHNLQVLRPCVLEYIDDMASKLSQKFNVALDAKKLTAMVKGGGSTFTQVSSQSVQPILWEQLEEAMQQFCKSAVSCWHLQKVLMKKRDPLSHQVFIDLFQDGDDCAFPLAILWSKCLKDIKRAFGATAAMRGGIVKDTLLGSYPKLAALVDGTLTSILKDTTDAGASDISDSQTTEFFAMCAPIESEYLASIKARIESIATSAFPGGNRGLPSQVDLQSLAAQIHEEIKLASVGQERLVNMVCGVIGSVLLTIVTQAENMAADSGLVASVSTTCNPAQTRNISLSKALEDVYRTMQSASSRLPAKSLRALEGPMERFRLVTYSLLLPIFRSQSAEMEKIIQKMHSLNFGAEDGSESEVAESSSYVRDLMSSLMSFRHEYLSKCLLTSMSSGTPTVAHTMAVNMAGQVLTFWVKEASLVRPLTNPGKLQFAKDAAEIESGIEQHLMGPNRSSKSALMESVVQFKSFRRLVFLDEHSMDSLQDSLNSLPITVILHHLLSQLPPEIESPYTRNKLSVVQYSTWIDDHSDEEILKQLKATLETGRSKVKHPLVDMMIQIIDERQPL